MGRINFAVNCSKSCDTVILVKKGHSESAVVFLLGKENDQCNSTVLERREVDREMC